MGIRAAVKVGHQGIDYHQLRPDGVNCGLDLRKVCQCWQPLALRLPNTGQGHNPGRISASRLQPGLDGIGQASILCAQKPHARRLLQTYLNFAGHRPACGDYLAAYVQHEG